MLHDGQSSSVFFDVGVSHQFVPVPGALQHKQPWFDRGIDGGRGMHTLDGFTTEGEMKQCQQWLALAKDCCQLSKRYVAKEDTATTTADCCFPSTTVDMFGDNTLFFNFMCSCG